MASIVNARRSTMESSPNTSCRGLFRFVLVVAASAAAASIWAQTRPADGFMLDAQTWQQEVSAASPVPWPADGWWRLVPQDKAVDVRAVKPGDTESGLGHALYLRLPGATLKQGLRRAYAYPQVLHRPQLGAEYELTLGAVRFNLRVEEGVKGMEYAIGYGGQTYTYVLGPAGAARTGVRAVADLDGDARPDFLVDVDDATYLLLSTQALPGANFPTAELLSGGC
jgi:hypothetical protein